jgi:hypothetical protein
MNINNIYCSQWLINKELIDYCKKSKYPNFYIHPHHILHIKDSINFKAIENNNFEMYNNYVNKTKQLEHSEKIFKNLYENFDINYMNPIVIQYNSKIKKYIIRDGVHRLCILINKNIIKNEIPMKYLNII